MIACAWPSACLMVPHQYHLKYEIVVKRQGKSNLVSSVNLKNKTVILPGKKSLGMAGNYKIQDKEVTGKPLANPTNTAEEFHFYGEEGGNWGRLF